jgi:hypothetical protein
MTRHQTTGRFEVEDSEFLECDVPAAASRRPSKRPWIAILVCFLVALGGLLGWLMTLLRKDDTPSKSIGAAPSYVSTTYRIDWATEANGCSPTNPDGAGMSIMCGSGVVLQYNNPWNTGCQATSDERVVICDQVPVEVQCYGAREQELFLSVRIFNATYDCSKFLREAPVTDERTGTTSNRVAGAYGGSVAHRLQVSTQCAKGEWISMTSTSDSAITITSTGTTVADDDSSVACSGQVQADDTTSSTSSSSCVTENSCQAEYECSPFECDGDFACQTFVEELTLLSGTPTETCTQTFPTETQVGQACWAGIQCASNACVLGVCAEVLLADGAQGCTLGKDCSSGACATPSLLDDDKDNDPNRSTARICCPSGLAVGDVCGGQPAMAPCLQDEMCASRICVSGLCQQNLQQDNLPCDNDSDCLSETCGISLQDTTSTRTAKACCPFGTALHQQDGTAYCSSLQRPLLREEDGEDQSCENDSQCEGSTSCAISKYSKSANRVCCRQPIHVIRPDSAFDDPDLLYCSDLPEYEPCGSDDMCANRACGRFNYTYTNNGNNFPSPFYDDDVCCPSGESVIATQPNAILATAQFCTDQPKGASCGNDEMCADGSTCARATYTPFAENICCSGKLSVLKPNEQYTSDNYCTDVSMGQACGDDLMCATGICRNNLCVEGQTTNIEPCETKYECDNRSCGLLFYDSTAPRACCPTGIDTRVVPPGYKVWTDVYCAGLSAFTMCGRNDMCAEEGCGRLNYTSDDTQVCCPSGNSVEGIRPDRSFLTSDFCTDQPVGAPCGSDNMCTESSVCGRESYTTSANSVCCRGGRKVNLLRPGDSFASDHFCTDLSLGEACGSNDMCKSAACVNGLCVEGIQTGLLPLEACANHAMCVNSACGRQTYTTDPHRVCCPSGNTVKYLEPNSKFLMATFCTDQPIGAVCGNDDMCSTIDNGAACALSSYSSPAQNVCCPGGAKVRMIEPGSSFETDTYCIGIASGEACGANMQCQSDQCDRGFCT